MRIAVFVFALAAATAIAANQAIQLNTAVRFEFTSCASAGSASQNVTPGNYLMRVTTADTFVCFASTCSSGGEQFPQGSIIYLAIGAAAGSTTQPVSCRSSGSNGNVIFTQGL